MNFPLSLTGVCILNLTILFFHQQEPNINSFSVEGYKLDVVKGNIEFKNIHFKYPSRQNVKVGTSNYFYFLFT